MLFSSTIISLLVVKNFSPRNVGFSPSSGYNETIASPLNSSTSTIAVSSIDDADGVELALSSSNKGYFTIDPGQTDAERVVCTGVDSVTTSLTGCTRGLASSGSSETGSASLASTHDVGSKIIMTNIAQFFGNYINIWDDQTKAGVMTFSSLPKVPTTSPTDGSEVASWDIITSLINQGAATSTPDKAGIGKLGTGSQIASSTPFDDLDPHFVNTELGTSTPTVRGLGYFPVSENDGYLNQSWLDLSESWDFLGDVNFSNGFSVSGELNITSTTTMSGINIANNVQPYIASTSINAWGAPKPVYIAPSYESTNAGKVALCDGNIQYALDFIGFAVTTATTSGDTIYVQRSGIVNGFTGLTPGDDYYVSDSEGVLSTTVGTYEIYVGRAISTTQISIEKKEWQYVGSATISTASTSVPYLATKAVIFMKFKDTDYNPDENFRGEAVLTKKGVSTLSKYYVHGVSSDTEQDKLGVQITGTKVAVIDLVWNSTINMIEVFSVGLETIAGTIYYYR